MADTNAPITNPLQTNNTALTIIAYVAGVAAAKLPWFDLATWNYIILSIGGVLVTVYTAYINRKAAVVSTVAAMPEVKTVELNKSVPGAVALCEATPSNVVTKP